MTMKPTIKKILYATDLSANSSYAYQYAVELAKKHDADIIIVHVIEDISPGARSFIRSFISEENFGKIAQRKPQILGKIEENIKDFCERAQAANPECIYRVQDIKVYEGYPAEVILEKADEFECDVIVIGTHGKGFVRLAFLGNVAEKIIRRSKKPVLAIPLPMTEKDFPTFEV